MDDISLHYFTQGEGKPVLIIHGGPGIPYTKNWSGLDSLSNQYPFYSYDQRGCGKSTRPFDKFESSNFYQNMKALDENLGLPAQIADIEQIRRKLKQDKIILIGHSFGGFLACMYAIEFPQHVESMVLVISVSITPFLFWCLMKSDKTYLLIWDGSAHIGRAQHVRHGAELGDRVTQRPEVGPLVLQQRLEITSGRGSVNRVRY